ncbi:hypothetical protein [Mycobacteroides chelonae]|uniref:hypothetical protein n=1 Tax=Mycobacteroides chelonae TaxID=1774 RepID=UPI0008A931F9|nr:hypothetical protein [Mycobacteroides chelonae]OHT47932.1 hypothetical protein BKG63_24230 [Mycobacteroides chelonae]OHT99577.1 hypothetical protein BKG72_03900 [Mycobacteroides chelonae]OLT92890.1 hypothetical protein BKG59_05480 [Mycobacteroides chelonae]
MNEELRKYLADLGVSPEDAESAAHVIRQIVVSDVPVEMTERRKMYGPPENLESFLKDRGQ